MGGIVNRLLRCRKISLRYVRAMEQVAADIEMRLVYSQGGQPRGRGKIERFIRTVHQLLLANLPGYAPAGGGPPKPSLILPELDALFGTWLVEEYHQRRHGETGQPPVARWAAGGFLPRLPASLEQLDLLLLTVARFWKVHPDGIRFAGFRYVDPTLASYVGEAIILRYDPRDMAELRVFHRGAFVCRAICPEQQGVKFLTPEYRLELARRPQHARSCNRRPLASIIRLDCASGCWVQALVASGCNVIPKGKTEGSLGRVLRVAAEA